MAPSLPSTSRQTRSSTGNSKPRIFAEVPAPAPLKKSSGKKKSVSKKLGLSKTDKAKSGDGKVTKKSPVKKVKAAVNGAAKKIEKAVKKIEAKVESKPESK